VSQFIPRMLFSWSCAPDNGPAMGAPSYANASLSSLGLQPSIVPKADEQGICDSGEISSICGAMPLSQIYLSHHAGPN
jgi:hypothetical protein